MKTKLGQRIRKIKINPNHPAVIGGGFVLMAGGMAGGVVGGCTLVIKILIWCGL